MLGHSGARRVLHRVPPEVQVLEEVVRQLDLRRLLARDPVVHTTEERSPPWYRGTRERQLADEAEEVVAWRSLARRSRRPRRRGTGARSWEPVQKRIRVRRVWETGRRLVRRALPRRRLVRPARRPVEGRELVD